MGVYLGELDLVLGNRLPRAVEDDEARARGTLVYGADVELLQPGLVELLHLVAVDGRALEILTLDLGHWLRVGALCRGLLNHHGCAVCCGWPKARGQSCGQR